MDLNLSPDEIKFRDELRTWLAANAPTDWDERREESMESRFEYLKHWQHKLYEGGWAGISWPKEYGGRGASLMEQVIFWQEMALAQAPPLANVLGLGIIGPTIIAFGTEAQKKRHLAKILSADLQQADRVLKQASRRVHRMQRGRLAEEVKIIQ